MTPRRYARLRAILDRRQPDLTVLVDNVSKPHNVSAVIRTCDAVGVPVIHAVSESESFRANRTSSSGTARFVEVRTHPDHAAARRLLKQQGMQILAADLTPQAVDFRSIDYTRPTAILLGAEKLGVSENALAAADDVVTIPIVGAVESLNVSVAAAVILYEAQRQRQEAGRYDHPQLDEASCQKLLFEWGYKRLAAHFRNKGWDYPRIGDEGEILDPIPRG